MKKFNPTTRFSDRVANYVKYRPSYPEEAITSFIREYSISKESTFADIGSGTGIFSKLLLEQGMNVFAIEPNLEMRTYAENHLKTYARFESMNATAENTGLKDQSVDVITCAQAFHWFELEPTLKEFNRILKSKGFILLIWNERKIDTPFLQQYEDLLIQYAIDYTQVNHMNYTSERLASIFSERKMELYQYQNCQLFDLEALKGRLLSSSYSPKESHPNFKPLMTEIERLFETTQKEGTVSFDYDCSVYVFS
ncbi:MAG: class I SAM-dependent methyltransferase [Bacteroidota bacterium]